MGQGYTDTPKCFSLFSLHWLHHSGFQSLPGWHVTSESRTKPFILPLLSWVGGRCNLYTTRSSKRRQGKKNANEQFVLGAKFQQRGLNSWAGTLHPKGENPPFPYNKMTSAAIKTPYAIPLHPGLFNRDPYNGLSQFLYNWVPTWSLTYCSPWKGFPSQKEKSSSNHPFSGANCLTSGGVVSYKLWLVGGFNPFEKYLSNWIIPPSRGENTKSLKPPPSKLRGVQVSITLGPQLFHFALWNDTSGLGGFSKVLAPKKNGDFGILEENSWVVCKFIQI